MELAPLPTDLMGWTAPEWQLCARAMDAVTQHSEVPSATQISTIGLDLAKQVFQVHGVDPGCLIGIGMCDCASLGTGTIEAWALVDKIRRLSPASLANACRFGPD